MKKIFVFLSLIVLATSCDWFVFDNQEYYNASVEGKLLDTKTGQPLQFAFPNTCKISIIEEGWKDKAGNPVEETQSWYVKCNGIYVNKLVWAAKYRMETKDQNFYPVSIPFELQKGENTVNFEVTPYCRILDPQITFEDNKIVARFKVDVEDIAPLRKVAAGVSSSLSLEHDVTVSVSLKPAAQFRRYSDSMPFYQNVLREGIRYVC